MILRATPFAEMLLIGMVVQDSLASPPPEVQDAARHVSAARAALARLRRIVAGDSLVWWLVAVGVLLRCYHFARQPSLWQDEAALVMNVLDKDFRGLLGPLTYSEAAPPLFLWLERLVVLGFGDSLNVLRLVPLIASCLSVWLVAIAARRILEPKAATWAVLLFACSDRLLWHACEAKPYSVDVFLAAAALAAWSLMRSWPLASRLVVFGSAAPLAIWLSYPGSFLAGAWLVACLPDVWRAGRPGLWLGFACVFCVMLIAFGSLYLGPIQAQRDETIVDCWNEMGRFAPWGTPWRVPIWSIGSTVEVVGYDLRPIGELLFPIAIVGGIALWRKGHGSVLIVGGLPIAVAWIASLLRAYPYGGIRVLAYSAPAVALFVAAGIGPIFKAIGEHRRLVRAALCALLLAPASRAIYRTAIPWPRAECGQAAEFVLANRSSSDAVLANHWEYEYYFRGLSDNFTPARLLHSVPDRRTWVVATGITQPERLETIRLFSPNQWRVLDTREFRHTTVLLVEPLAAAAQQPARLR